MSRSTTIFLALAALVAAVVGLELWLLLGAGVRRELLALALGAGLLVVVGAMALAWAWLELRVLRPLRRLADDVHLITHGNPRHVCGMPAGHGLGSLPESVNTLAREFLRARHETAKAMETAGARAERGKARLEAILRDLSEGVVVCTLQHRVVLYNDAAAEMLSGGNGLGLNRPVTALLEQQPLRDALGRLYRQEEAHAPMRTAEFQSGTPEGRRLRARMQLVHEGSLGVTGYVLCLDTPERRATPPPDIEERPFYYDFDLFEGTSQESLRDVPLAKLDCVVFDSETTGLRPSAGDQILQIAGVRVVNGRVRHEEVFDHLANPGVPVPPASTRIHGITEAMVRGAPPVAEVVAEFHEWVDGLVLVAHNAAFDMRFLELQEPRSGVRFRQPVLDSLLLSVLLNPQEQDHTLDALMARLGVEMDPADRHRALGDAVATAEVYVRMLTALAARGVITLGDALDESARLYAIRREQERF